jgi:hypothetical protein
MQRGLVENSCIAFHFGDQHDFFAASAFTVSLGCAWALRRWRARRFEFAGVELGRQSPNVNDFAHADQQLRLASQ